MSASRDLSPTITGATPIEALPAHTPGPWSVPHFAKPDVGCECGYVLSGGYAGAVCTVHASGEGYWLDTGDNPKFAEACANALLIAAAPDLLEALRAAQRLCAEALPKFDWGRSSLDGNAIGLLNEVPGVIAAAIAKATSQASGEG